jgi:hypothetical protein
MITYHLDIVIGGRAQRITIHADHRVINESNHVEFYDSADKLIATVPVSIIVDTIES